jgi:hypothetical protein
VDGDEGVYYAQISVIRIFELDDESHYYSSYSPYQYYLPVKSLEDTTRHYMKYYHRVLVNLNNFGEFRCKSTS